MNKQNLGYRLGKWYLKFHRWQQPIWVKMLFILFAILLLSFILYILRYIIAIVLIFILVVYLIFFLPDERYQHAVRERARFMQDVHKQMVKDGYESAYGYTKKYDDNLMGGGNGTGNGINL